MSKISMTSKRHFTVVMGNKENGLYISSRPSSAAKKAVTKLCASNKWKKVEFHIREITRDSKKKTYGPYIGYLEKLDKSIKLKEYMIKYNPVVKLKNLKMRGGTKKIYVSENKEFLPYFEVKTTKNFTNFRLSNLVFNNKKYFNGNDDFYLSDQKQPHTLREESNKKSIFFNFREDITEDILKKFLEENKPKIIKKLEELRILGDVKIDLYVPYISDGYYRRNVPNFKKIKYVNPRIVSVSEITPNDISNMVEHVLSLNNVQTNLRYLNIALKYIGINICLNFFGEFLSNFDDNLPIISVGSGTAYFEFLINRIFRRDIVCVDPDPTSYTPRITENNFISRKDPNTVFIPPKFNTVNKLLSARNHDKYKDCLLLLNWPNPMFYNGNAYDPYDFNAIIKLKPIGFFIVYETEHGSGSDYLIKVLKDSNAYFKISEEEGISYELLDDIKKNERKPGNNIYYRIAYYRRKKDISNLFNNNFFNE